MTHQTIMKTLTSKRQLDRRGAFTRVWDEIRRKHALRIDITAEHDCCTRFQEACPNIFVYGEENLPDDLREIGKNDVCVLVDMVDGTDLLEIGIPMWCSAMVIFDPSIPKIIGAVVGLATGEVYSATSEDRWPQVSREVNSDLEQVLPHFPVYGPSQMKTLDEATVMFFGQKAQAFLSFSSSKAVNTELERLAQLERSTFRIHTLAGNPMMVKLVDREHDAQGNMIGRGADAIFENRVSGQHLHDLVPGAYIAIKAGAYFCGLDGRQITETELAEKLLKPKDRMRYVLASTPELAAQVISLLKR
jgi:fructose-1,6-bisphosphatase/inositol monophosphatase family enzyme